MSEDPTKPTLTIYEPGPGRHRITINQDGSWIYLSTDTALELAYLLMSIGKGQVSGRTHTIPKDPAK